MGVHVSDRQEINDKVVREPSRVVVMHSERLVDDIFQMDRVRLSYERYDGTMGKPVTRLVFERGDAVAVLPYDRARRRVALVRQFRYPAHVREGKGWIWEIVAGIQDEEPEEAARRETQEEAGLDVGTLIPVVSVFPSAGACTERVRIYVAPVAAGDQDADIGGLEEEGEDILVKWFGLDQAMDMVRDGEIVAAAAVIALQFLVLHWDELP